MGNLINIGDDGDKSASSSKIKDFFSSTKGKALTVTSIALLAIGVLAAVYHFNPHFHQMVNNVLNHKMTLLHIGLYIEVPLTLGWIVATIIGKHLQNRKKCLEGEKELENHSIVNTVKEWIVPQSKGGKRAMVATLAVITALAVSCTCLYFFNHSIHDKVNSLLSHQTPLWQPAVSITAFTALYYALSSLYSYYQTSKKEINTDESLLNL